MEIKVTDQEAEAFVKSAFQNFPEASNGSALVCIGWKYELFIFKFMDQETGKKYTVTLPKAVKAFKKALALIAAGKLFIGVEAQDLLDDGAWDAIGFDALAQLACLGEVIYG